MVVNKARQPRRVSKVMTEIWFAPFNPHFPPTPFPWLHPHTFPPISSSPHLSPGWMSRTLSAFAWMWGALMLNPRAFTRMGESAYALLACGSGTNRPRGHMSMARFTDSLKGEVTPVSVCIRIFLSEDNVNQDGIGHSSPADRVSRDKTFSTALKEFPGRASAPSAVPGECPRLPEILHQLLIRICLLAIPSTIPSTLRSCAVQQRGACVTQQLPEP